MFYFDPSIKGYNQYRNGIHMNCYTGILHGIGMPIASVAFFVLCQLIELHIKHIYYSKSELYMKDIYFGISLTKIFRNIIFILFFLGYLFTFPIMGIITIIIYYKIVDYFMDIATVYLYYNHNTLFKAKTNIFIICCICLFGSISILEFLSHGYLENTHSNIFEFFNSIYHTPVYGFNSFYYIFTNECTY